MVKNETISAAKANRLYWLGRYEERVYLTLHLLRKCYDRMIDGHPEDYEELWHKLDSTGSYTTPAEFRIGMLYDEENPCSIMAQLNRAMDNAIMLREDIKSETLSYIEMSLALMNKCKKMATANITLLQPITDWALAFWGSATERMTNRKAISIMTTGRIVEHIDVLLRYDYPSHRVADAYNELIGLSNASIFDNIIESQLSEMIQGSKERIYANENKEKVINYINNLVII